MRLSRSELRAASQSLAHELRGYARRPDVVVLARIPAVVPLAVEVAQALQAPLDVFLVRPLIVPDKGQREIGIVASGGVLVLDSEAIKARAIPAATIAAAAQAGARELARSEAAYRGEQPAPDLRHRRVIVVDDGRADLSTWRMTIAALKRRWVARVVLAAPTMPIDVCRVLLGEADEIVAALTQQPVTASRAPICSDDMAMSVSEVAQLLRQMAPPLPTGP